MTGRRGPSPEMLALARELAALPEAGSVADERAAWDAVCAPLHARDGVSWQDVDAGGVSCVLAGDDDARNLTILYCHGGAFAIGSPWHNRDLITRLAAAAGARVLAVDYRLAPEHPFPAALDDTVAAYRWLLEEGTDPAAVVFAGDSCGAALVLGTLLEARAGGGPQPAGVAAISPWVDLTQSGWSYEANRDSDGFITKESLDLLASLYLDGADPTDPTASPAHADVEGLPPVLLQVGSGEALFADALALTERIARAHGSVTLQVWPGAVHVWPMWAARVPEGQAAIEAIARFARACARGLLPVPAGETGTAGGAA